MIISHTRVRLAACTMVAMLGFAPAVHAQSLTLNDGDSVTVSGAGTVGITKGAPIASATTAYRNGSSFYAVETNGTAVFYLCTGGSIVAEAGRDGLFAVRSGPSLSRAAVSAVGWKPLAAAPLPSRAQLQGRYARLHADRLRRHH